MLLVAGTNRPRPRCCAMANARGSWLVINGASGSFSAAAVAQLAKALGQAGHPSERTIDCQNEDLPDRAMLEQAGVQLLSVFAGDGTVNAALSGIEGWGGQVLVLPGGTTNLLAKSLHGEARPDAILAALGKGRLEILRRHCIHSDQGTALCEVLAGPGASWSDVREEIRNRDVPKLASKTMEAVRQSTGGPMVRLTQPETGKAEGYSGLLLTVQADGIALAGYGADGIADTLRQGLAVLRHDFREGPHDDLGTAREVVCTSVDNSPIELMIDGERRTGSACERFSLAPLALDLLALGHG